MARIEFTTEEFAAIGHPATVIVAFDPDTNTTHVTKVRREFAFALTNRLTARGLTILASEKVPG